MDYKIILGTLAVIIGFIGYVPYYRDIFKGKTKPHAFSWFGWVLLEGIGFFAQLSEGAGPGTWVTFASALLALGIAILSLRYGEKDIKIVDWIAFAGGILGIILWRITKNPLSAIILVVIADALLFVPTYRKAFHKPYEETFAEYFLSFIKWIFGVWAIQTYNLTTTLYPVTLILTNGLFALMLIIRRRQLKALD